MAWKQWSKCCLTSEPSFMSGSFARILKRLAQKRLYYRYVLSFHARDYGMLRSIVPYSDWNDLNLIKPAPNIYEFKVPPVAVIWVAVMWCVQVTNLAIHVAPPVTNIRQVLLQPDICRKYKMVRERSYVYSFINLTSANAKLLPTFLLQIRKQTKFPLCNVTVRRKLLCKHQAKSNVNNLRTVFVTVNSQQSARKASY